MDEGSGTTLADNVGSQAATLNNGGNWTTVSGATGDTVPVLDGSNDYWITDNAFTINGTQFGVCGWVYINTIPSDFTGLLTPSGGSTTDSAYQLGNGWEVLLNGSGELVFQNTDGSENRTVIDTISVNSATWYFYALAEGGDTADAYLWDNSSQISATTSVTAARGTSTTDYQLMGGVREDNFLDAYVDVTSFSTDTRVAESDFESIWQNTQR